MFSQVNEIRLTIYKKVKYKGVTTYLQDLGKLVEHAILLHTFHYENN